MKWTLTPQVCLTAGLLALAGCGGAEEIKPGQLQQASSPGATFGTLCQSSFQNGWQNSLSYVYDNCQGFVDQLSNSDWSNFYFNLHGARPFIETDQDQNVAE